MLTNDIHSRTISRPESADGFTVRSGAPTSWLIRLDGEARWRRLMIWQFSNAGTLFVRIKGRALIVREHELPTKDKE